MTRAAEYAARNRSRAEARACLARIPRPAPLVPCASCGYIDRADCALRPSGHVWPIRTQESGK